MSATDKKVTLKLGNIEYVWHKQSWVTAHNNLTVSTSLSQKLTEIALKQNLLTKDDFVPAKKSK